MAKPVSGKGTKVLSLAFSSENDSLLKELSEIINAALAKVPALGGGPVPMTISKEWSQTGGWVREQDGWPQKGGWYLSKDGMHLDQSYPPLEESVSDVLAAFQKASKEAAKKNNG